MKKVIRDKAADFNSILASRSKTNFSLHSLKSIQSHVQPKQLLFKKILKFGCRLFYKITKPFLRPLAFRVRQFLLQAMQQNQQALQMQVNQLQMVIHEIKMQQSKQDEILLTIKHLLANIREG